MKTYSVAIGSDHAGFAYKEAIKAALLADGHTVRDFGTYSNASCDYPDFIRPTAEAVAQVGAILILAKPENHGMLIFFRGMERVRFRAPVHVGDQVIIEARVKRLKSRMGVLEGRARVGKKVVIHGTMTFALGSE